jgi:ribosome recycling factor
MFDDLKVKLEKTLEVVQRDMAMVRTGRATPALIEQVRVEAYPGTMLPLVELAGITAPDPHMLVVQPWDQSVIRAISEGISKADLKLNPMIDGQLIRITIPALTEERRLELTKLVKQKVETGRKTKRSDGDIEKKYEKYNRYEKYEMLPSIGSRVISLVA